MDLGFFYFSLLLHIAKRVTILNRKLSNIDYDLVQNEFHVSSELETITPDYLNELLINLLNL